MIATTAGESVWGVTEHLLAAAVDALNAANWQRTGKGPRPKPVKRPGAETGERFGSGLSREELDELLDLHVGRR